MLTFRGHRYKAMPGLRLAAIPVSPNEKAIRSGDEGYDELKVQWTPLTNKLLAQYSIKPTSEIVFTREADGVDVIYDITQVFQAPATIRFDINVKKKSIQEIQVRLMCKPPHSFVASSSNDVKELMSSLKVVGDPEVEKRPGSLQKLDAGEVAPEELIAATENILMLLVNAGTNVDITDLDAVVTAVKNSDEMSGEDIASSLDVLRRWTDKSAYKNVADSMQVEAGSIVGAKQAIFQIISEITKHEDFVISDETINIQAYRPNGAVVISLATPWPTFVELKKSGAKLALENFAIQICNIVINSGPSVNIAKALLTVQVNLILAGKRAANPAISKQEVDKYNWTPEQVKEFIDTGIGIYMHAPITENNPVGQYDVACVVRNNSAILCYEKGYERQIVRNEKMREDLLIRLLKEVNPDYYYIYDAGNMTLQLLKPGDRHAVKVFKNVEHEFANTKAPIATERIKQTDFDASTAPAPNADWYDHPASKKARQQAAQESMK